MLHREGAAVLDRYASSRSPPDHLLYHMLKIVPVCGGGSDVMVEGSTCGRAGRRFRRMSFVFLAGGSEEDREDSLLVVVRALSVVSVAGSWSGDADRFLEGEGGANIVRAWTTSAISAMKGLMSEEARCHRLSGFIKVEGWEESQDERM